VKPRGASSHGERNRPDSSGLAEHLRLVHFTIVGFCVVAALSAILSGHSRFAAARLSVQELLRLQPILNPSQKDMTGGDRWRSPQEIWARVLIQNYHSNLLPKGDVKFTLTDTKTQSRLVVSMENSNRWFVTDVNRRPGVALPKWTVDQFELFWNSIRGAQLKILDSTPSSARGFVAGGFYPHLLADSEWRDLETVPVDASKDSWTWDGFLTDTPDRQHTFMAPKDAELYSSEEAYIDNHSAGGTLGKYEIDVVKVGAAYTWIDLQGDLALSASAHWPRGSFEFTFPELADITKNLKSLRLADVEPEITRQEQSDAETLKIAGVELRASTLGLWGGAVLVALQLYFLVHLLALRKRVTTEDRAWDFPWLPMYRTSVSYVISTFTVCLIPAIVGTVLLPNFGLHSCDAGFWLCRLMFFSFAVLNVTLCIATIIPMHLCFRSPLRTAPPGPAVDHSLPDAVRPEEPKP
jgi:hypothetical protein